MCQFIPHDKNRTLYRLLEPCSHRIANNRNATVLDMTHSTAYDAEMSKRRPDKLSDQIRQAMGDSGLTRYRIAAETDINESSLGQFYHGERGLSLESLDRLGQFLQLRIIMERKPEKKGR